MPEDPTRLAAYYAGLAEELAEMVTRLGAFDRALSTLPVFLFSTGMAVFVIGTVLHTYESAFRSPEFHDFSLFAIVLVVASVVTYIAEIRMRAASDRDKAALAAAHEALAALVDTTENPAPRPARQRASKRAGEKKGHQAVSD